MSTADYAFLAVCIAGVAGLLIGSKVSRAIFLECLRHPFRPSRIEIEDGKVSVAPIEVARNEGTQPPSPAGAR